MSDPIDIVKIVKNLPSRPRGRACVVLTHNYYEQKEYVLAIQNLKKILVKKNQKNKLYFPAFFQLGKLYFENHQYTACNEDIYLV